MATSSRATRLPGAAPTNFAPALVCKPGLQQISSDVTGQRTHSMTCTPYTRWRTEFGSPSPKVGRHVPIASGVISQEVSGAFCESRSASSLFFSTEITGPAERLADGFKAALDEF